MSERDVTDLVSFKRPDDEILPLTKCVCGHTFDPWTECLNLERDDLAWECPNCRRRLYWRQEIRVVEIL